MRSSFKAGLIALLTGTVLATSVTAAAAQIDPTAIGLPAVGLVDGTNLVTLRTAVPLVLGNRAVTGLGGDVRLVGIDYRVQDGKLYGVGNAGGLYTLNPGTGAAAKIGQLTIALDGTNFGVDFNPAANALRIISDTGQNLRQPFAALPTLTATVADTALSSPPAVGTTTGVTGAAYTNNDLAAATGTTLFGINTANDTVVIQSPANSGQLVTTGSLGVDAGPIAGFDIYSRVRGGVTASNSAFATLQVDGRYGMYSIDLLTGAATRLGVIDGVTDIAIALN